MDYQINDLNRKLPTVMCVDINSCFATVEQQANPLIRDKPVVVAAYTTSSGCILASSIEAKRLGIKTGMRVRQGKLLCPNLIVLPPDAGKYRAVHLVLKRILEDYSDNTKPKSIDEFMLDLEGYPSLNRGMITVAEEIKERIKSEAGEWISVSIGIGTSRFWAKTASNLKKPDGLEVIDYKNVRKVYSGLELEDLCGINRGSTARLNGVGIYTVSEFLKADISQLKAAFKSVNAYYWYWRLRGWEIDDVDFGVKSFSQSYALPKPLTSEEELMSIMAKLVEKMTRRMRQAGYETGGINLGLIYCDRSYWNKSRKLKEPIYDSREIFRQAKKTLSDSPKKPVANLSVACFLLRKKNTAQLVLFDDVLKKERLSRAQDEINDIWGDYAIGMSRMMSLDKKIIGDKIAFGGIRDM